MNALLLSTLRWSSTIVASLLTITAAADERISRWQADLDIARDVWLAKDRSYSAEARSIAERRLMDLRQRLPLLDDDHVVAELARIAALSGNAHTRAYVLRNRGYWRRYPVRLWKFADGWRVVAAQGPGLALLGRKVVAIGNSSIERAQVAVRPLFAANDGWADYMATYSLTSPEALRTSAVIPGDSASFIVSDERGRLSVALEPSAFAPRERPEESWWFLSPAHPGARGWTFALADTALPVALKSVAANYWASRCSNDVLYFQFNRAQDAAEEPLIPFGERLVSDVRARPPRTMVIDLRFNTGGDASKGHQFLKQLTALPWVRELGRLQVILGPVTFSAGITHAVWLRQETAARIVGSEPGDELDTWAEGGNVDLPNSGLRLHFSDRAHRYSKKPVDIPAAQVLVDWNVDSLTPDVAVDWNWQDYLKGRDPYTEAALGAILDCPG